MPAGMENLQTDADNWIRTGRNAARQGKTGEALDALLIVTGYALDGVQMVLRNQATIFKAIEELSARLPKAPRS